MKIERIQFLKDGSNGIKLGSQLYKPYTLEEILNVPSMFYVVFGEDEDEDGNIVETKGVTQWFNWKGLTYVKV